MAGIANTLLTSVRGSSISRSGLASPSAVKLWLGGGILLWLLYVAVFGLTGSSAGARLPWDALANVLPLMALALATYTLLRSQVMRLSLGRQTAVHCLLALLFALTWYALVSVLLGFLNGLRGGTFAPEGFSGPAATWQMFQGLILYALVAALCYAIRGGREAAQVTIVAAGEQPRTRYLLRDGEGLRPVDTASVVAITGAQDYSEIATLEGRHLVRMSLSEFEKVLDRSRFVRVHRSAIINLDHLDLAEPAGGGRMVARMVDGQSIAVSRSGATMLRSLVA